MWNNRDNSLTLPYKNNCRLLNNISPSASLGVGGGDNNKYYITNSRWHSLTSESASELKIVIKTKKPVANKKTLNKIYLEIINYLVNYEQYSLDTITNIKKYWQRFYLFKYLIYNMFNFYRYNFNKKIY
ncbi:hypothetical protein [Spiroplasma endosymbiont of Polydrusus formosus]|uniref:hypothetical protein n=1 Tax=Spiroplasma endosymbiont of Polydrusus formosus TaxID=3139326 RepID=UPI0035B53E4F